MKYGYFNNSAKEYVITNPKTPVKWINYIGTINFGGFVDHTGGSLICKDDPALNRITKYIPQLPSSEFKGETLYIRIKELNSYTVFSPFFVPTLDQYDLYECHIGLSYVKIISEFYGIRTEATIFIPIDSKREIRDIKIINLRNHTVSIDVIPLVEYTHFDALKQLTNADWVPQTMQSKAIDIQNGNTILLQYAFMNKESSINYFTSNRRASSFETDREVFLGENGYGTFESPLSLKSKEFKNTEAKRGNNIAALMLPLNDISPNESKRIITQLGQCNSIEDEKCNIEKYRNEANVTQAFEDLKAFWDSYLSKFKVTSPDEDFNTMVNIHNPKQCYFTKNWSRYLSLYQLGFGSRGIGFRDTSQDLLSVLSFMPEEAFEMIKTLLTMQKQDGSAMHQFNPITLIANEGDSRENEDAYHYYSDDHLWVVILVCEYIKETGNIGILETVLPYYDKDKYGNFIKYGTIYNHITRALEFTMKNTGSHNLPLLGFADWNDTVNLPKGAESIFTAELFGYALKQMLELTDFLKDATASKYKEIYENLKKVINDVAWDGNWYIRYFDNLENPLGSSKNSEGKIYVNAQSFSVISGFATEDRAALAMDSVNKMLATKNGIKLSAPGYKKYDKNKGGISTYPPGAKENGGIFLHTNPWAIIAETMLGNGNRAFEYYCAINPALKNNNIDEYECEPYVYAQNILGDEHPQFGAARNSWLSGTASWVYISAVKHILGIRAGFDSLIIEPCIPDFWKGYTATRIFRNTLYNIEVLNESSTCGGVKKVYLDGVEYSSNRIPIFNDEKPHSVKIII